VREERVTCDQCGKDKTTRTNCEDYRIVLQSEMVPGHGAGVYTAMAIRPQFERPFHFCGKKCLRLWIDANIPAES
jgi:hypothetical protein